MDYSEFSRITGNSIDKVAKNNRSVNFDAGSSIGREHFRQESNCSQNYTMEQRHFIPVFKKDKAIRIEEEEATESQTDD